ncbi:MAG: argininosuccinate synthase [Thermococcus sp.]|uniref:argininosuccinate synthase n=1 Tax=Thermococcus sp. TaxID=35749 RepID=UPI001D606D16|nr:argininosuccinate synthase [Thermococcus sp.]MBO8173783.1 argininosuccinate synthase [Thermococcus sp.]
MKVVLAYSGGLDTSVILKLMQEKLNAEVITVTVDVGQKDDFKKIEEKALKFGAVKHYTIDAKEEFAKEYLAKAIKANALYEGAYPLATALARPLIAKKIVEIAKKENADAIAHGCTGKGNDQVRFDLAVKALYPEIKIIAPVREWGLTRDWEMEYAKKNGIPVKEKIYSIDENLWGRSIEGGILEDPSEEPPEEVFEWTLSPEKTPEKPEYVTIEFEEGVPVALNGREMGLVELIETLNFIAGKHGVGRIDHIEDRAVGIKSREVYEAPAAITLIKAHKDLEKFVLTKWVLEFKEFVDSKWSWLVYNGLWFEPLREALDAFIDKVEEKVSGTVKVKLYKGNAIVVGRKSENALYDINLATFEKSDYDQKLAIGFIELFGMQSVLAYSIANKLKPMEAFGSKKLEAEKVIS